MPRSRRPAASRRKNATPTTPPQTTSRSSLAGIVDAAYQAGTVVAGTARWLIAETVRAAESIVADAGRRATPSPDGAPARKPLARLRARTRTTRRRRRAS